MKALTSLFSKFRPIGATGDRAFLAYKAGDYIAMAQLLENMSAEEFIRDVRKDDINIMHHCTIENNYEALGMLTALPYFSQVVNDNSNEAGWTPLLTACARED